MSSSKRDVVSQIRRYNQHVAEEFLDHFDEAALRAYLARLRELVGHRGRTTRWVRQAGQCAAAAR